MNTFKLSALAAALAGALAMATAPASAASIPSTNPVGSPGHLIQVAGGHGHHGHGGHRGHWRGGRGFGIYLGAPAYGVYGGGYGGCGWLHRRAINTGSRYWWRRYRECRGW